MSNPVLVWTKKHTESLFFPLVKLFAFLRIPPNVLTFFSIFFGFLAVMNITSGRWTFFILAAISLILDTTDGRLARYTKKESELGKWLDWTGDRAVETLLILLAPVSAFLVIIAFTLFVLHNSLYIFKVRIAYYFRTWFMLGIFLGIYDIALAIAIMLYAYGIIAQLKAKRL